MDEDDILEECADYDKKLINQAIENVITKIRVNSNILYETRAWWSRIRYNRGQFRTWKLVYSLRSNNEVDRKRRFNGRGHRCLKLMLSLLLLLK